jgi:hypothetical protein
MWCVEVRYFVERVFRNVFKFLSGEQIGGLPKTLSGGG